MHTSQTGRRQRRARKHDRARPRPAATPTRPAVKRTGERSTTGAFGLLRPELQEAIAAEGYTTPTPIQERCIEHLLNGRDVLGSAQTGTGKTAAFTLPMLQRLVAEDERPVRGRPRALILAPTRELAAQIGQSISVYGQFLPLTHTVIFGGVNQNPQVRTLERGVDILVATPGRLLDLMQQKHLFLDRVGIFVLDEVDRMLDMGFIPDIKRILKHVPDKRHTLFFSATMAPKMEELARTMVQDPVRVNISPDKPTVDKIDQKVMFVDKSRKDALLSWLMREGQVGKAIVFTQMKHVANRVVTKLAKVGVHGAAIHGNKSQGARTRALDGFRSGKYSVLVATDVAARGIDVDGITHVINYDLPVEAETYIHRIGRTARAGEEGIAISLCTAEDRAYLRSVEKLLGNEVPVDRDHGYHSEEARHSTLPPPKRGGGGHARGPRSSRSPRSGAGNGGRGQRSRPAGRGRAGSNTQRRGGSRRAR